MTKWLRRTKVGILALVIAVGVPVSGVMVACGGAYPEKPVKRQELRNRANQNMRDMDKQVKKKRSKE
ncbi:MAG TPA: hypothetical protein EYN66_09530 [Myxococcales bacterium]|nr:hypothetical protein [Myxococcales bacterium]